MSSNDDFYTHHVSDLNAQYLSVTFEEVHDAWLPLIEDSKADTPFSMLDVGTGVGRDADYFLQRGYKVVAIDSCSAMLEQAKSNFPHSEIRWLQDSLPNLSHTYQLKQKFDVILVSAVYMHVPPSLRQKTIRKLSGLLKPNGKLILTLRHGNFSDGRVAYPVDASIIKTFAQKLGLRYSIVQSPQSADDSRLTLQEDALKRTDVRWETVVLTLPDDGTGSFPLLRNIVINDAKAATYKVALLRSILRIAEGHQGAVIRDLSDTKNVVLPLGLVALYWMKLFKPLLDHFEMPQNSNPQKGLGFVKQSGWQKLKHLSNNDLFIGALHTNLHKELHSTLLHITDTIKNMPAKYITLPGTSTAVFEVNRYKTRAPVSSVLLDFDYLQSFGVLVVPRNIWHTLSDFSCWIEPALVNEWIRVMQGFETASKKHFSLDQYHIALRWEDEQRSTKKVRERIKTMQTYQSVPCTWSNKKLNNKFDIDHTFPFARWPNNDLWNLVPTKSSINREKSDKLITQPRAQAAKYNMTSFWQEAWASEADVFFAQANVSLPDLRRDNRNFDDVFESMLAQRTRIKQTQQLADW